MIVWLKDFGYIKLFRTYLKDQARYYAVYQPSAKGLDDDFLMDSFDKKAFETLHSNRTVSSCHQAGMQRRTFQVRSKRGISKPIFASLTGYVMLQKLKIADVIDNCYRLRPLLFRLPNL